MRHFRYPRPPCPGNIRKVVGVAVRYDGGGGLTVLSGGGLANSLRVCKTSEYASAWLSRRRRSPHMSGNARNRRGRGAAMGVDCGSSAMGSLEYCTCADDDGVWRVERILAGPGG